MEGGRKEFVRDVIRCFDYLDGVLSSVIGDVEVRKEIVFRLVFMLLILKLFEDYGLVLKDEVREVFRSSSLFEFLGRLYGILGRYADIEFLKVGEVVEVRGMVDALRRVYEYGSEGKKGWRALRFYDLRELGGNYVLGDVYEGYLSWFSSEGKKKMGVYYTPKVIVEYMCRESLFYYLLSKLEGRVSEEGLKRFVRDGDVSGVMGLEGEIDRLLSEVKVCDPACGAGAFLVGMLEEIVRLRRVVGRVSEIEAKKGGIERSLYGIDIDGRAVEVSKMRLWFSLIESVGKVIIIPMNELRFNVVAGNALLEFPEGSECVFDIVVGNPPYVRHEKIKELKPFLQRAGYRVFTSTADLYVYFYERGYQLLKERGILSYITSNKWLRAEYGRRLREFLGSEVSILEIIDFSGCKVFEVAVDTCILTFRKEKPPKGHVLKVLVMKDCLKG
jgi:hypothetical protein